MSSDPVLDMRCPVNPCRIDYLPTNADVQEDDKVVTSGLGGVYPEGLLIGRVKTVELHDLGLYRFASVVPAADLQNLRYVFVVKKADEPGKGGAGGGNDGT